MDGKEKLLDWILHKLVLILGNYILNSPGAK